MITEAELDPVTLREALGHFPSGVVAVCAEIGGESVGLAASSFVSVSLAPPLVAICVQNTSTTWPMLRCAPRIGISVLAEEHQGAVHSLAAKTGDRFAEVGTRAHEDGALFVGGASVWLTTTITQEVTAGDHAIVVMDINRVAIEPNVAPIVFHRSALRRLEREPR